MKQEEAATQEQAEIEWLNEVDLIDPFYGSPEKLEQLLATAPNVILKTWLAEQIDANKAFATQLFGGGVK